MLIFGAFLSLDSIFILHNQWYQFVNEFNADLTTGIRMAFLFSNYKFFNFIVKTEPYFSFTASIPTTPMEATDLSAVQIISL